MYLYRFTGCGNPATARQDRGCYELSQILFKLQFPDTRMCDCALPEESYLTLSVLVHHTYLRQKYWATMEIAYWEDEDFERLGAEEAEHGWMWRDRRTSPACEERAVMALDCRHALEVH